MSRTVSGLYDVVNTGITATVIAYNFSLTDIPGYTEFTSMFQTYCIEQVEIWWRPEYTVLSDSAPISNAVNVEFSTAIDLVDGSPPVSVDALLEYQSVAHTPIVANHYRKIHPAYLIDNISPSCALISTSTPNTNWYGVKCAVPACGTAMTFRSFAKFKVALVGLK